MSAVLNRVLAAAKLYAFNYLRDQLADPRDCVDSDTQHFEVTELFAAIAAAEAAPQAAPCDRNAVLEFAAQEIEHLRDTFDNEHNRSLGAAKNMIEVADDCADVVRALKNAAPESAEPSDTAVTNKAHGMYRAMVDSSGVHENRWPGWRELPAHVQDEWKVKASEFLATSSAAKGEA